MVNLVALPFETILFMAFLDIACTHFHFFLIRKKGVLSTKQERTPIIRKFFLNEITPLSFLAGLCYVFFGLIFIYLVLVHNYLNDIQNLTHMIFGIYILINYIHVIHIQTTYKNWNNEAYWKAYKELVDAEIV
jgi:hypothetical protein